jgi:hypothetical protein
MVAGIPGHIMPFLTGPIAGRSYKYYTMWVDVFSHFLFGTLDENNDATAAVRSKTKYE